MSTGRGRKRRCIIQRLDFENCIVTNSKTTTRGRKKLRARITREVEDVPLEVPTQEDIQKSPVLIRTRSRGRASPVFPRKRNVNFSGGEEPTRTQSTAEEPRSPSSPVFKLFKKSRISNQSLIGRGRFENAVSEDSSSSLENSYQIDEATTQESKGSLRISSVESAEPKNRSFSICSGDSRRLASWDNGGLSGGCGVLERGDNRKGQKKKTLLGRLHKLQQKQASVKLLWQHQNRTHSASSTLRFTLITFWRDEFNFFLKCCSSPTDPSPIFLVVDSRWVPNLRHVKEASVLRLHPPWQEVSLDESNTKVLLNVICLEILDETEEVSVAEKRTSDGVSAEQLDTRGKLFVDSLFCSNSCGFLF